MFHFLRKRRRKRLRAAPFPPEWRRIVEKNFPLYHHLPAEDQQEILEHIQVFLAEKNFEGCGGLKITDEIKVTIASQACMLLLNRDDDFYPSLQSLIRSVNFLSAQIHVS